MRSTQTTATPTKQNRLAGGQAKQASNCKTNPLTTGASAMKNTIKAHFARIHAFTPSAKAELAGHLHTTAISCCGIVAFAASRNVGGIALIALLVLFTNKAKFVRFIAAKI